LDWGHSFSCNLLLSDMKNSEFGQRLRRSCKTQNALKGSAFSNDSDTRENSELYERLRLLWERQSSRKDSNFDEKLRLRWESQTFMKDSDRVGQPHPLQGHFTREKDRPGHSTLSQTLIEFVSHSSVDFESGDFPRAKKWQILSESIIWHVTRTLRSVFAKLILHSAHIFLFIAQISQKTTGERKPAFAMIVNALYQVERIWDSDTIERNVRKNEEIIRKISNPRKITSIMSVVNAWIIAIGRWKSLQNQ
jgi:hypothetical protein